jgi:hypothetical protein
MRSAIPRSEILARWRSAAPSVKGYDAEAFVEGLKARGIEPHIAINGTVSKHGKARKTAVPSEVAASVRYAVSQRLRKRIGEGFGWTKTVGGLMQVKVRGLAKVCTVFVFAMAAYNIVRLPGPEGRSAFGGLKGEGTMTRRQARTSKMSRICRQKSRLPLRLRKRSDFFSSLLGRSDDFTI